MLNGQYVGCTTGFSQSDKTNVLIPNQQITADNTPYLQRLVAVGLIKLEEQVNESIAPASLASHQPIVNPEPDGFWIASSRIDAYNKAGEIVKQMSDEQYLFIVLDRLDGTSSMIYNIPARQLKNSMFGHQGGFSKQANAGMFLDFSANTHSEYFAEFKFVNDNGVPTGYDFDGSVDLPHHGSAGFLSLTITSNRRFIIQSPGGSDDLAEIFGLEHPKFVSTTELENARYITLD